MTAWAVEVRIDRDPSKEDALEQLREAKLWHKIVDGSHDRLLTGSTAQVIVHFRDDGRHEVGSRFDDERVRVLALERNGGPSAARPQSPPRASRR